MEDFKQFIQNKQTPTKTFTIEELYELIHPTNIESEIRDSEISIQPTTEERIAALEAAIAELALKEDW